MCTLWPNYQHFVDDHRVLLLLFWFVFVSFQCSLNLFAIVCNFPGSIVNIRIGCCRGLDGGINEGGGGDMFSHITLHYITFDHTCMLVA